MRVIVGMALTAKVRMSNSLDGIHNVMDVVLLVSTLLIAFKILIERSSLDAIVGINAISSCVMIFMLFANKELNSNFIDAILIFYITSQFATIVYTKLKYKQAVYDEEEESI